MLRQRRYLCLHMARNNHCWNGFKCQCSEWYFSFICALCQKCGSKTFGSVICILYPICYWRAHFVLTHSGEIKARAHHFLLSNLIALPLMMCTCIHCCTVKTRQSKMFEFRTRTMKSVSRSTYPVNLIADTQRQNEFLFAAVTHWSGSVFITAVLQNVSGIYTNCRYVRGNNIYTHRCTRKKRTNTHTTKRNETKNSRWDFH